MFERAVAGGMLEGWRPRLMPSPHYRIGLRQRELYDGSLSPAEKESMFVQRQAADLLTLGRGLCGSFACAALVDRQIPCLTGHRAVEILSHDSAASGVVAATPGGNTVEVRARRAVILATGGYGWASDAADLEGLPDFAEAGPPTIQGDHLALATRLGAAVARGCGPQFSMGAVINVNDVHPGTGKPVCRQLFDVMGMPHTLVVNRAGIRFGDESYYVGINEALRHWDPLGKRWTNFPCFLIFDEQYRRAYCLPGVPVGSDYPATVRRGDSLPALAALLGIDGDALVETVDRFNQNAEDGIDPDFDRGSKPFVQRRYGDPTHKPNANLGSVSEPPFYGIPLRLLGTGMCTFGLSTDAAGRVLTRGREPIERLYATGNAAATSEFRGYVTGYANSRNIALSYAAMNAAAA
jgi:3-oxosteroid 1-dehydrogenase